jgi:hypothetical protein
MYKAGQVQLQSTGWMQKHTGDRPSFDAVICRSIFSGSRRYRVFAMARGLLFLPLEDHPATKAPPCMGTGLAGAARTLEYAQEWYARQPVPPECQADFDIKSDEEILKLAGERRQSFVAKQEEITRLSIDPPGAIARLLGTSVAGLITLRDRTLGKVTMEVREQLALTVAVESLPKRLGERAVVNVQWDEPARKFVPRR